MQKRSKSETLSSRDNHAQAEQALMQAKRQERKEKQEYIRIKVLNGYILVAPDKYARKKRYYHSLFGIENIIL